MVRTNWSLLCATAVFHCAGCGVIYDMQMESQSPPYGKTLTLPLAEAVALDPEWQARLKRAGYPRAPEKTCDLNFIEKSAGCARTIVYFHGNPGSIDDLYYARLGTAKDSPMLIDELAKDYRIIAIDRPGHGYSVDDHYDPCTHVALLRAALRKLNVVNPVIVGHSWGGTLAMMYALSVADSPNTEDSVAGLVLLAPVVNGEKYNLIPCARFLHEASSPDALAWAGTVLTRGSFEDGLREVFFGEHSLEYREGRAIPEEYQEYASRAVNLWSRSARLWCAAADDCRLADTLTGGDDVCKKPDLSRIAVPIRLLVGEHDSTVPRRDHAVELELAFKGKKNFEAIKPLNGAHLIQLTNAQEVCHEIRRLARDVWADDGIPRRDSK